MQNSRSRAECFFATFANAVRLLEEELGSSYDRANHRLTDIGTILRFDLC